MGGAAARSGGLRGSFCANRSISHLQGEGGGTLGPQGSHRSPGLPCPKRVSRCLPSLPEGAPFSRAGGAPRRPARPVILQEAEMPATLPSSPLRSPTSGPALGVPAPKPPDPKNSRCLDSAGPTTRTCVRPVAAKRASSRMRVWLCASMMRARSGPGGLRGGPGGPVRGGEGRGMGWDHSPT